MKRWHAMPFGAAYAGGATRFRLWAPAARRVELELGVAHGEARHELLPSGNGWYETTIDGAGPGSRYSYRIDDHLTVPDPASRFNPDDVHGASAVVDSCAYDWDDAAWRGRRWEEAIIYELHVGAFTDKGTFAGAIEKLDHLVDLGVTALELMPVADFPGRRNWGYDGVLLFAPDASYGAPDDLKRLVDAAHQRGLMMVLDVVYNHFGPEGNYLHAYASDFFNERHATPWGAAINYDGSNARVVRDFVIENALYWLEEFHFDGLRLDAVHAIADDSTPHIVAELADRVRNAFRERHVHIVLENDLNQARWLGRNHRGRPVLADAQWNDDLHHAAHVITTGEHDGYYADYANQPLAHLGRCLAEGFAYQGEVSDYRHGERRGEPSKDLPSTAFVIFTQTHDQVGNRAFGERLVALVDDPAKLRAVIACVLLSPSIPMLFMGEEWGAAAPFLFFCDFGADLALAVTRGRREEFKRFARFRDPKMQASIPDPNSEQTFTASRLDWSETTRTPHAEWLTFYRDCIRCRTRGLTARLPASDGHYRVQNEQLQVDWTLADDSRLSLVANFGDQRVHQRTGGTIIYPAAPTAAGDAETVALASGELVVWVEAA